MRGPSGPGELRFVRRVVWLAAAVLAVTFGALALWHTNEPQEPLLVTTTGEADVRSQFSLTDHTGRPVTEADFAGRWQLVYFGYTNCPDVCPTTLAYMASVLDRLGGRADRVAPLFITVDPARDTVPVMAAFVAAFSPRLIGLTGTEAQVAEAARNFRTYYERMADASAPGGYLMAHSGYIYLMTPKGRFDAVFREGDQPPAELAEEILMRIEKEK